MKKLYIFNSVLLTLTMFSIFFKSNYHLNNNAINHKDTNNNIKSNNNYSNVNTKNSNISKIKMSDIIQKQYNIDKINQNKSKIVVDNWDDKNMLSYNYDIIYGGYTKQGLYKDNFKYLASGYTKQDEVIGANNDDIEGTNSSYVASIDITQLKIHLNYSFQPVAKVQINPKYLDLIKLNSLYSYKNNSNIYYSIDATGILTDPKVLLYQHTIKNGNDEKVAIGSFGVYNFYATNGNWSITLMSILAPPILLKLSLTLASATVIGVSNLLLFSNEISRLFNKYELGVDVLDTNINSHDSTDMDKEYKPYDSYKGKDILSYFNNNEHIGVNENNHSKTNDISLNNDKHDYFETTITSENNPIIESSTTEVSFMWEIRRENIVKMENDTASEKTKFDKSKLEPSSPAINSSNNVVDSNNDKIESSINPKPIKKPKRKLLIAANFTNPSHESFDEKDIEISSSKSSSINSNISEDQLILEDNAQTPDFIAKPVYIQPHYSSGATPFDYSDASFQSCDSTNNQLVVKKSEFILSSDFNLSKQITTQENLTMVKLLLLSSDTSGWDVKNWTEDSLWDIINKPLANNDTFYEESDTEQALILKDNHSEDNLFDTYLENVMEFVDKRGWPLETLKNEWHLIYNPNEFDIHDSVKTYHEKIGSLEIKEFDKRSKWLLQITKKEIENIFFRESLNRVDESKIEIRIYRIDKMTMNEYIISGSSDIKKEAERISLIYKNAGMLKLFFVSTRENELSFRNEFDESLVIVQDNANYNKNLDYIEEWRENLIIGYNGKKIIDSANEILKLWLNPDKATLSSTDDFKIVSNPSDYKNIEYKSARIKDIQRSIHVIKTERESIMGEINLIFQNKSQFKNLKEIERLVKICTFTPKNATARWYISWIKCELEFINKALIICESTIASFYLSKADLFKLVNEYDELVNDMKFNHKVNENKLNILSNSYEKIKNEYENDYETDETDKNIGNFEDSEAKNDLLEISDTQSSMHENIISVNKPLQYKLRIENILSMTHDVGAELANNQKMIALENVRKNIWKIIKFLEYSMTMDTQELIIYIMKEAELMVNASEIISDKLLNEVNIMIQFINAHHVSLMEDCRKFVFSLMEKYNDFGDFDNEVRMVSLQRLSKLVSDIESEIKKIDTMH